MADVRPLRTDDFPAAHATFLADAAPDLTADAFRSMFDVPPGADGCGYALDDGGRLVGMLGTLVHRRVIDGRDVETCNLHSWFVLPEYRGYSLALMRPILRSNRVLTDLSPSRAVCAISLRLGFRPLDGRLTLLFRPWGRSPDPRGLEILTDREEIARKCRVTDPTALAAIGDESLRPLLATDGDGECLVLAQHVSRHCRPHCRVHHLSDPACFARWSIPIRRALLDVCGSSIVAVETRRLGGAKLPFRLGLPISSFQLVRPNGIDPSEIDTLGTELLRLGLTTLPQRRLILESAGKRARAAVAPLLRPFRRALQRVATDLP